MLSSIRLIIRLEERSAAGSPKISSRRSNWQTVSCLGAESELTYQSVFFAHSIRLVCDLEKVAVRFNESILTLVCNVDEV